MRVVTRPFTPSDEEYDAVAALAAAAPGDLCDFEPHTGAELREQDARLGPVRRYVAADGGEIVGCAHAFPMRWAAEPGLFWVMARISPAARGVAVGRRLLDRVEADLRALGARAAHCPAHEHIPWLPAALARRGYREIERSWEFTLQMTDCDPSSLAGSLERVAALGLTLTNLADERVRCADWLPRLFALHEALTRDVPLPEHPFGSPEWFAEFAQVLPEAFFIARGGERYVGASFMHPAGPGALSQKTTGVLRAYRGRGVATALKLLTLDFAIRQGYRTITTWIEASNASMLAVSAKLGFRRAPGGIIIFEKRL